MTERKRGGQPRTGKPARNRLVVLLDDKEWAALAAAARELDTSRSDIARCAIELWLEMDKTETRPPWGKR